MSLAVAISVVVMLGFVGWLLAISSGSKQRERHKLLDRENMPVLLRDAKLLLLEQRLEITDPVWVSARVDEVYQITSGELAVVDTKVRKKAKVRKKDQVKLSTYSYILRQRGFPVLGWGYLRFVTQEGEIYKRVPLLSEVLLIRLFERSKELDTQKRMPKRCGNKWRCDNCDLRRRCEKQEPGVSPSLAEESV